MNNSFFSDLDSVAEVPQSEKRSFFSDIPEEKPGPRSIFGQKHKGSIEEFLGSKPPKGRNILADVVTTGTSFAGLPGDLASILVGDNPLTSDRLREKAFEFAPSLAPKNEQEKAWDEGLSMVMGLATPSGPIKAGGRLLGKGISKLGGAKVSSALKGKYKELYEIGKDLGIDEKALAPFRHGKVTGSVLKSLSKLGEEAKKGVEFAEKSAAPFYEKLDKAGQSLGPLNRIVKNSITRDFNTIIKDIEKSPALVNESKDVIKFLQEAKENLRTNPEYTAEGLMSLYKQMNRAVNWGSIRSTGKGHLVTQAKDAVLKGIYGTSPKLGKEFSEMNKLYAGYKNLAKEVTPNKWSDYANKGPAAIAVLSFLSGRDLEDSIKKAATFYIGKKAASKISAKLLTDPKWVGLKEKIVSSVKNGKYEHAPKLLAAIKKKAEMEHIDFDLED